MDLDRPGKDSFLHRQAGAEEVLVVGGERWALLRETPGEVPDLRVLAARLAPVDLVLVEGFKTYDFPKLEVYRAAVGKPPLWLETSGVAAVASDSPPPQAFRAPWLPLNDARQIAAWIAAQAWGAYTVS